MIIDHLGFGVSDYPRGKAFYTEALAPLGMEFGPGQTEGAAWVSSRSKGIPSASSARSEGSEQHDVGRRVAVPVHLGNEVGGADVEEVAGGSGFPLLLARGALRHRPAGPARRRFASAPPVP